MAKDVAPPLRDGRYRLVAMAGAGGTSTIYRAYDTKLGVYRAIKLLHDKYRTDPRTRHRFEEEAAVIAGLRHPHIVTVYDVDSHGGMPFIVMDYAAGGSLMQRVDRLGALEPAAAVHLLVHILDALHFAHERGVVHRDIKPHNILFGPDDTPLLTDFGVALRVEERLTPRTRQRVLGTPSYMAPEQAANPESASPRSDVYSAGLTLYVLLTGRQPFAAHERDDARRELEMVHPKLADVALQACASAPERRFASAAEMAGALLEVADELPAFRPELLHAPGTAPLRRLAPPPVQSTEATWPPLAADERSRPTAPSLPIFDPRLETESLHPIPQRQEEPRQVQVSHLSVLGLLALFAAAAGATWLVLGRITPALAAMTY